MSTKPLGGISKKHNVELTRLTSQILNTANATVARATARLKEAHSRAAADRPSTDVNADVVTAAADLVTATAAARVAAARVNALVAASLGNKVAADEAGYAVQRAIVDAKCFKDFASKKREIARYAAAAADHTASAADRRTYRIRKIMAEDMLRRYKNEDRFSGWGALDLENLFNRFSERPKPAVVVIKPTNKPTKPTTSRLATYKPMPHPKGGRRTRRKGVKVYARKRRGSAYSLKSIFNF